MDSGDVALVFGLLAVLGITAIPNQWRRAFGGLLILLTLGAIVTDAARLVFG